MNLSLREGLSGIVALFFLVSSVQAAQGKLFYLSKEEENAAQRELSDLTSKLHAARSTKQRSQLLMDKADLESALCLRNESLRDIDQAVILTPQNVQRRLHRAKIKESWAFFQLAIDDVDFAIRHSKNHVEDLWFYRGTLLREDQRTQEAIESYGEGIRIRPTPDLPEAKASAEGKFSDLPKERPHPILDAKAFSALAATIPRFCSKHCPPKN